MKKQHFLFSNYYGDMYSEEDIKEMINEDIYGGLLNIEEDDINDVLIYDYLRMCLDNDFDDFKINFKEELDNHYYVVTGTVGRWDGRYSGGIVVNGLDEIMKLLRDCEYISIVDNNGHLEIKGSHHDGTNYFEVRELTDKGYDYYTRNEYLFNSKELCEKLYNSSNYSRLPRLHKKVFGC